MTTVFRPKPNGLCAGCCAVDARRCACEAMVRLGAPLLDTSNQTKQPEEA